MKRYTLLIFLFISFFCIGQEIPKFDFVSFSLAGDKNYYTGKIDTVVLKQNIESAKFMGRCPIVFVGLFYKGVSVEYYGLYSLNFISDTKRIYYKSKKFNSQNELEKYKTKNYRKKNVYVLEKYDTSQNNQFLLEWYKISRKIKKEKIQ